MPPSTEPSLTEVSFDELQSVDEYEATFTGALDGDELTLTYTLDSAIDADDQTVHAPGDPELDRLVVQPETYEFDTDDRETVRFTATDDDGEDLFVVYAFAEAEDTDDNAVGLSVESEA